MHVTIVICEGEQSIYLTEECRLQKGKDTDKMDGAARDELDGDKLVVLAIERLTRTPTEIKCTLGHKPNISNENHPGV